MAHLVMSKRDGAKPEVIDLRTDKGFQPEIMLNQLRTLNRMPNMKFASVWVEMPDPREWR